MKKNIYYLLGFIVIVAINYLLKGIYDAKQIEELNQIHFLSTIDNALKPFGLFLLLKFFSTKSWKFKTYAIFYSVIMVLELSLGYFYGNGHFDYNYLIGCILGLILVYGLDHMLIKMQCEKQHKQAT